MPGSFGYFINILSSIVKEIRSTKTMAAVIQIYEPTKLNFKHTVLYYMNASCLTNEHYQE